MRSGRRAQNRCWLRLALAAGIALALAGVRPAGAEAPPDPPTLYQRTYEADLVAHVRIVHPSWDVPVDDGAATWPVVETQAIEILKGDAAPGRLTFVRDGEETPAYAAGQEALVFLRDVAKSESLAHLSIAGIVRWASFSGRVESMLLTPETRAAYVDAIRGYVAVGAMEEGPAQLDRMRTLTVELIASSVPALARSAIRDLTLAGNLPLVTKSDVRPLAAIVWDPAVAIATRVALLDELERRGLIFGPTAWARMVRETRGRNRLEVVRALQGHQSAGVNQALVGVLQEPDEEIAGAAATALGSLGNRAAVAPLLRALGRPEPALRSAVVRALGRIATQGARQALDTAAEHHPDPETRREAFAAAIVLARRHGTTLAPMIVPVEGTEATSRRGHAVAAQHLGHRFTR
jgi:HEAT repeats